MFVEGVVASVYVLLTAAGFASDFNFCDIAGDYFCTIGDAYGVGLCFAAVPPGPLFCGMGLAYKFSCTSLRRSRDLSNAASSRASSLFLTGCLTSEE